MANFELVSMDKKDLDYHRQQIDRLDRQIVQMLNDRISHAVAIGEIKIAKGEEIYAPHREVEVLNRICSFSGGPIRDHSMRAIYREIMSAALVLEKSMTIAYLGPAATYTHQAAMSRFGASLRYVAQKTISDVFAEVSHRRADYGVAPVENSTEGVVTHTLDMFLDSDLKIVAQIVMRIQHCLVTKAGNLRDVRRLYTHPQALGQCRGWRQRNLSQAEVIETSSTTRAAELAAKEEGAAAIASSLAAETYDLEILERDLQDNPDNVTRFLVLGRKCGTPTGNDRTSLMFSVRDEVGALHRALSVFHNACINMTKIESRPSRKKAWEYFFFVDIDGHERDQKVAEAIESLREVCDFVKVLGSYPL